MWYNKVLSGTPETDLKAVFCMDERLESF